MAISVRYHGGIKRMQRLLKEADIDQQPTIQMPATRGRDTDRLPPLEFYRIEETYPLMKVVRAVQKWMERGKVPPRMIGVSYATFGGYWQALRLSVYYYRLPDGQLWTIELKAMDIHDNVVYCSAKRA